MPEKLPMSNEVLAVHVDYLRGDVQKVLIGMADMATKSDVEKIASQMKNFVTVDRFEALEKKVDAGTISSSFDRGLSLIIKVCSAGAAVTAFVGVLYAIFQFYDKIKALI